MSDAFETIVGKVCLERGWVSREQLVDCLRQVATAVDTPVPEGSRSRLSDMLISKGLVSEGQMDQLREEVSRILATDSSYTVVRQGDSSLGQILVQSGACRKEHLVEALSIQQHAAGRGGDVPRLGEILIQKGYATFAAIEGALDSQKARTQLHCVPCRTQYAIADFNPKKKYLCKKCSGQLLPPGEVPNDLPGEVALAQKNPKNLLGKYVLLRELGRGGMGVVYKAYENGLRRTVALKILAGTGGHEELARFRREAQTAASLRHPNIVGIYEVVEVAERHAISMEYVDGRSLAGERMSAAKAAPLMAVIARAVEYAHSRNIIHRDLKPHNIMLDKEGKPFVMDFGLAKSMQSASHITMSGTVVGTPSYMAPEQASGKVNEVGRASDVYSLGALLYELVTGLPPFKGPSAMETLRMVVQADLVPPSRLSAAIPKDFETIILKCLDKEPSRRYPTAGALAEDLERFSAGTVIAARREQAVTVVGRRAKRHWVGLTAAGASLVALLLIAFIVGRGPAKAEEIRSLLQLSEKMADDGDLRGAMTKLEAARALDPENPSVRKEIAELARRMKERDSDESRRTEEARAKAQPEIDQGRVLLQRARLLFYQPGADFSRMEPMLTEAVERFTKALSFLPHSAETLDLRGQAHALLHRPVEAEKDFTAALKEIKSFPAALAGRARLYLDRAIEEDAASWKDKARADLEAYRKIGGGDREQMELAEGLLAFSEKDAAKALSLCDRMIGRKTVNEEVYKLKGDAFSEQAKGVAKEKQADLYRQAVLSYGEAISRRVNYAEAYLARGHVHAGLGHFSEAVADWEKALALGLPKSAALAKKISDARGRVGG